MTAKIIKDLDVYYGRRWEKPNSFAETKLTKELAKAIGGKYEVVTPVGRIDLLTDHLIVEAKKTREWKGAIGQLFCYELYHYRKHRGIGIIGEMPKYCPEVCEKLNLILFHYSYNDYRWRVYTK